MKRELLAIAVAASLAACATNPVTGRRELALISESQEIAIGQEYAQQVEQSLGLVDDASLQAYVRRVGARLAAESERPNLPWRFGVVDDAVPNAFALPGGPVYITRGLMDLMDSEAELATVLGHEIGHITARHSVQQLSRAQLGQLGLALGSILSPTVANIGGALSSGLQVLFLKYGRDAERQADELGFKYALNESYDVAEMDDVFLALQRVGDVEGRSGIPSWLATHPDPGERIKTTQQRVAALPAPPAARVVNRPQYLNEIDGLIYGENPRAGFFRNNDFLHPDLRFRMTFPSGWKTQNMRQAVLAVSPNRDAIIELTLAQGSPSQAAQQFFNQQGVQAGQSSTSSINGNPAFTGYFQAQAEQGVIAGVASFLSYNGNTYRLLAYTSSSRLNAYDPTFRNTIGSFSTLTDATTLNVKPNRIDIVRIDSPMSVNQFHARYPSVIPIRDLVIINQVADANATLPGGSLVKRVIPQ
ncbi:MAG: M48 family metalloprotease [Gemmatimonadota bacterium]